MIQWVWRELISCCVECLFRSTSTSLYEVFLPMRYAEPQALCPLPDALLSGPSNLVSDPPTWLPSVLVGHLYCLRSPATGAWAGFSSSVPWTAFRCAAMNSRRSVLTMHGEAAAGCGGAASFGATDEAAAFCGLASADGSEWSGGGAAAASVAADGAARPPRCDGGQGRLASNEPCTSCRK